MKFLKTLTIVSYLLIGFWIGMGTAVWTDLDENLFFIIPGLIITVAFLIGCENLKKIDIKIKKALFGGINDRRAIARSN